jgi:hypothetical protein
VDRNDAIKKCLDQLWTKAAYGLSFLRYFAQIIFDLRASVFVKGPLMKRRPSSTICCCFRRAFKLMTEISNGKKRVRHIFFAGNEIENAPEKILECYQSLHEHASSLGKTNNSILIVTIEIFGAGCQH